MHLGWQNSMIWAILSTKCLIIEIYSNQVNTNINWTSTRKNLSSGFVNNKGTD